MKSQDIVVLFKLVSLHTEFFHENSFEKELLYLDNELSDWDENEFSYKEPSLLPEYINRRFSVRSLENETGISKSQISLSMKRMEDVGLLKIDRKLGLPKTNAKALLEFIAYGISYVYPAKEGALSRGIATSVAAPVLQGKLMSSGELSPVWPYAEGKTKGLAVTPLHPNVDKAIQKDNRMYAY